MTKERFTNIASWKRLAYGALTIIVLFILGAHAVLRQFSIGGTKDFHYFYHAARAMWNGSDIYAAAEGHYIYPPFLAFVLQPLALMPEHMAAIIWIVLSGVFVFAAALIAANEAARCWLRTDAENDPSIPWLIAAIATLLIADKIHASFILGQTDCLMLLGFACVLRCMQRKPLLAGAIVGVTASIKYLSLIFVPYFLIKKNFRAAFGSIVAFGFFMTLPAVQIGFDRAGQYGAVAVRGMGRMMGIIEAPKTAKILRVGMDRSVSITSSVFRLTRSYGVPDLLAAMLLLCVFIAIIAAIVFMCRRNGVPIFRPQRSDRLAANAVTSLEGAVLIFLALAFSPQTTARHMVLLLLVNTVAIAVFLVQDAKAPRALLIIAVALQVAGLSVSSRAIAPWRRVGGASWCALGLVLAIVWAGTRALSENCRHHGKENDRF
jgi:Glycosyltransferase family 87